MLSMEVHMQNRASQLWQNLDWNSNLSPHKSYGWACNNHLYTFGIKSYRFFSHITRTQEDMTNMLDLPCRCKIPEHSSPYMFDSICCKSILQHMMCKSLMTSKSYNCWCKLCTHSKKGMPNWDKRLRNNLSNCTQLCKSFVFGTLNPSLSLRGDRMYISFQSDHNTWDNLYDKDYTQPDLNQSTLNCNHKWMLLDCMFWRKLGYKKGRQFPRFLNRLHIWYDTKYKLRSLDFGIGLASIRMKFRSRWSNERRCTRDSW